MAPLALNRLCTSDILSFNCSFFFLKIEILGIKLNYECEIRTASEQPPTGNLEDHGIESSPGIRTVSVSRRRRRRINLPSRFSVKTRVRRARESRLATNGLNIFLYLDTRHDATIRQLMPSLVTTVHCELHIIYT